LGEKRKFEECKGSDQRIQERVLTRPRRYGKTRAQGRNIQKERIARKIYGKKIIWMVR